MWRWGHLVVVVVLGALALAPAAGATDDPLYTQQHSLYRLRAEPANAKLVKVPADVIIGVLDSGVDRDHPDIRFWSGRGRDFIGDAARGDLANLHPDDDPDPAPVNDAHGTLVSGVFGAIRNNRIGIAGIAPNARVMALRTCWPVADCYPYPSVQADAINWGAARGARIFNLSWQPGPAADFGPLKAAIDDHPTALFVVAAGNDGGPLQPAREYPCAYPAANIICVTAMSPSNVLCGSTDPAAVDIVATTSPGPTTQLGGGYADPGCYTSLAAPAVTGVAAILLGLRPESTPAQIREAIVDSATPNAAVAGKVVSGGEVNAETAVLLFQSRFRMTRASPDPKPDRIKPVVSVTTGKLPSLRSFLKNGLKFRAGVSERAALLSRITVSTSTRSKLRLHLLTVAKANSYLSAPGKQNIRLKPSKSVAAKLAAARTLKLFITVEAADGSGNAGRSQLVVKLK